MTKRLPRDEKEPADGEDGEGLGVDEPGAPPSEGAATFEVNMGAALDVDEDAIAAAAETSLDMDGFETGAGFDLEDVPDEIGRDIEVESMEVKSTVFDEFYADEEEPESSSSAEPSGEDPSSTEAVSGTTSGGREFDRNVEEADAGPPAAPVRRPTKVVSEAARRVSRQEMERRQKRRTGALRLRIAASAVIVLGLGGLAMAYWGVVEVPGITPPERYRLAVPTLVVPPGPQPETPVMSHVVFVDAWREAETPSTWAAALRERMPDLLGFVTPLSIEGDRRYALLVGPAQSAVEATQLRDPLATALALLNPDPDGWAVQDAPYSFFFGEYETLGEANGRAQELANLAIPAFVLQVTYAVGTEALRVYGGAFSDELQAGWMGRLLNDSDLSDVPLIERRGRPPR